MNALAYTVPNRMQWRQALRHPLARGAVIAALAISAVALGIGLLFTGWPAFETNQLQQTVERARHDRMQTNRLRELSAAYETTRLALPGLERKLAQPLNQAGAIETLRALANKTGLRTGNASFGRLANESGYPALSHEMQLTGSYTSVKRFLAALPESATFTTVLELRIEPAERGRRVRATVRLATIGAPSTAGRPGKP